MKYLVMLVVSFGFIGLAQAQEDTTAKQRSENQISCAYIDKNTMACYTPGIDKNNDDVIGADEWNEADVSDKGIIEANDVASEQEVFEEEGEYDYKGLYEKSHDNEYGFSGYGEEGSRYKTEFNFDEEEDGAFQ